MASIIGGGRQYNTSRLITYMNTMIDELVVKPKNINKKLLLASNLWHSQPLAVYENLSIIQTPYSAHLVKSFV
jgi:hypothetical protein